MLNSQTQVNLTTKGTAMTSYCSLKNLLVWLKSSEKNCSNCIPVSLAGIASVSTMLRIGRSSGSVGVYTSTQPISRHGSSCRSPLLLSASTLPAALALSVLQCPQPHLSTSFVCRSSYLLADPTTHSINFHTKKAVLVNCSTLAASLYQLLYSPWWDLLTCLDCASCLFVCFCLAWWSLRLLRWHTS